MGTRNSREVEGHASEVGEEQVSAPSEVHAAFSGIGLDFDPHKDLNLPSSYDEVIARFRRLQGDRWASLLN
jgi:hypothetical protein